MLRNTRLMRASSSVASGSAAISISPGICRTCRSMSPIGLSVRSWRRAAVRSTSPFVRSKASACAQTLYLPAGRAVADEAADHLVAAARRLLGQAGTVGARVQGWRQVADPAGLSEDLPPVPLEIVELRARLLGGGALRPRSQQQQDRNGAAF